MTRTERLYYDDWLMTDPNEVERCETCGANVSGKRLYQPDDCDGTCGRVWRDPDAELEERREREND